MGDTEATDRGPRLLVEGTTWRDYIPALIALGAIWAASAFFLGDHVWLLVRQRSWLHAAILILILLSPVVLASGAARAGVGSRLGYTLAVAALILVPLVALLAVLSIFVSFLTII